VLLGSSCSLLWTHFRGAALTEVDSPFIFIDKETLSFRSKGISYIDIIKLRRHLESESTTKNKMSPEAQNDIKMHFYDFYQINLYF
jgi:hypothetical protein